MEIDKKKLLLYGGGAAAFTLLVYFIFFNKPADKTLPPKPPKPPKPSFEDEYYEPVPSQEEEKIVTTRSGTRLREQPTTDSKIIKTYTSGTKLKVSDYEDMTDGTWYLISSPTRGWVRSDVVD